MELPGVPPLDWLDDVGDATFEADVLTMQAAPKTDWFNDPAGSERVANAPALMCEVSGDFQLEATINVDFAATFDAGVLFVHQTADDWAKLCFERDPTGQPMIVTVVTRGVSDDSNEPAVNDANTVRVRISRFGTALAFHYARSALDGTTSWALSRFFALRSTALPMRVGFLTQSPTGNGCTARFSDVVFAPTTLVNLRDGS
jgi:regulation of enolase protein 1 (concanavalin A-like superfamily)